MMGPSPETLDFVRQFARRYVPKHQEPQRYTVLLCNEALTLGEC